MKGSVNSVVEAGSGVSQKGYPWTRWEITIDGNKYSLFKDPTRLKPGDMVEYETVQDGDYTKLTGMPTKIETPPPAKKGGPDQLSINRAVAIKAVADILNGESGMTYTEKIGALLRDAQKVTDWLIGGTTETAPPIMDEPPPPTGDDIPF